MSIKRCSFYLPKNDLLICLDHKPLLKIVMGDMDNEICNTWGQEAATIPRCVKAQHIKEIPNVLADSVSRLRAAGLYHDLNSKDHR